MARKKSSEPPKIIELPKRPSKILSVDDYLEIANAANAVAIHSVQVEILAQLADKTRKFSDELTDDFYKAFKLRETQKEIFMETIKKILQ